jgi:hypothetical protein
MSADNELVQDLIGRIQNGEGTSEQEEQWLNALEKLGSDTEELGLRQTVKTYRKLQELTSQSGNNLSREQMIELVEKIQQADGTQEEIDVWQLLVERNVPYPALSDLIYGSAEDLSAEEIVDRALAYKPILLGPVTS